MRFRLVLSLILFISIFQSVNSQTWSALPNIYYANIYDFTIYNDTLVIAGALIFEGCDPYDSENHNSVMGWDSIVYIEFPGIPGSTSTAYSTIVYDDNLILGGGFDDIHDPDDIEKLAVWNGTSWEQLGGINWSNQTQFWYLCEYKGKLYLGGQGVSIQDSPGYTFLLSWDGNQIESVGFSDEPRNLCLFDDKLYAGLFSTFNLDNGELVHGITVYDGERWDHVYDHEGNLFTPTVTNMLVDTINHDFYIAGVEVYRWDGEKCHHLAYLGGEVYKHAMCMYRGDLIIGGNFHTVNELNMDFLARWDGSEWTDVAGNTSRAVEALYEYKEELYVGGYFDTVGGNIEAHGIARYYEPPVSDCHWLRPRVQTTAHQDTFYLTSDAPLAEVDFINNNAYAESWQWSLDGSPIYTSNDTIFNTYTTPGTYHASVEVTQDGCVKTAEMQIEVIDVTGISHKLNDEDIGLFPNPVMNTLFIKLPVLDESISVVVYNQQGQELLEDKIPAGTTQHKLDVYALSPGTYIVRIGDVKRSFVVR